MNQDVIKEHPISKQALMTSNIEVTTESDGNKRITVDVHNANKTKLSPNLWIPKQEGIKTKKAKANIFSKLNLKSALCELELHLESRQLAAMLL